MTTTPEQIELARKAFTDAMMSVPQPDPILAAINVMRPLIRAEALEEAAKRVAELPMIVGIPGLPYERHRNSFEYAAAIRALKEKKNG